MRTDPVRFDSYLDFYQKTYQPHLVEGRLAGRLGANMILVRQPAGDFPDFPTPDLALQFLVSPPIQARIDTGAGYFRATMEYSSFCVSPPWVGGDYRIEQEHAILVLGLPYDKLGHLSAEAAALPPDGDFGPLHSRQNKDAVLFSVVQRLWDEIADGSPGGALFTDAAVLFVLSTLLKLSTTGTPEPSRGGLAPWQLRRAQDYLLSHLAEEVTLAELAALVELSPFHFCRAFKRSTGVSPSRWQMERRVQHAQHLMSDPSLTLIQVALLVGYASQSAFGTAFRRVTGMPPAVWRRAYLEP